jgi:hypothetical protein
MLTPYYVTRLVCSSCGTFETGTKDRPDPAATCPWCDEDLRIVAWCRGETSRPLPYLTEPWLDEHVTDTPVDVINSQVSEKRRRNHGHGKSTGRKRGGDGRAVYRGPSDQLDTGDADRERYRKSKQDAGRPSDFNRESQE